MINENAKRNQYIKIALISIAIVALGLLVWKLDWAILEFFYNHVRNDILDPIVVFYTNLGDGGIIWIVTGLIMLIFPKYRKCGIMVLGALLVMLVLNNLILKNLIARDRPCWIRPEMLELVESPSSYSFPSGHTVSAMAVAFTILTQHKKLGITALVMAFLMGLSRLYVCVHFPTDVYGGIIFGAIIALIVWTAEKKLSPIIIEKLEKIAKKS